MSKLVRTVSLGVLASLGLILPATATEVLYPDPTGQGISAELGGVKVTRDIAFPEVGAVPAGESGKRGGLRTPREFVAFVGDSDSARALVTGTIADNPNPSRIDREVRAALRFGPNESMVVGVHLGNQGSQGYSVKVTRVEREKRAGGLGAITTVYYLITPTQSRSGSVQLEGPSIDPNLERGATFDRQRNAPAHFVRIPWLPMTDTIRYVDEGALTRFGNLEALALKVTSAGNRNVGMFVSNTGVVQGSGGTARALVDEMFRLGEAIRAAQPVPFARQHGADPVQVDGVGNLRDAGQFDLQLWTSTDTRGRRKADQKTTGSWEAVRERFEPVRRALQLIQWRLEGKIDIEDLERLEGRLGLTSIQLIVGASGLNVTVDEMGLVDAKKSGQLNEEERVHLTYVLQLTNPLGREARGEEDNPPLNFVGEPLPEKAELPSVDFVPGSIPGWAGEEFRLIVQDLDGNRRHFGGYLEGADARVHAIYQALEAIAARIENRPTRISGTVEMAESEDGTAYPLIKGHVLTWVIDPLEGGPQAEAVRQKLAEWNGRWVDVMARTRITTRESGEAVLVGKINYPQRGTVSGVIQTGLRLQLQEVLSRPTGVSLQLTGARSGALVGDQVGRWVTVQVYMFYDANYLPEVGFVEALQAVVSRREKIKFQLTSDQNGLLEFFDRPGGGLKVTTLHVAEGTYRQLWVTNRQGNYSFVPEQRGWARNDSELFHLSEDPKNVNDKAVSGGVFSVLKDVLSEQLGR